MRRLACRKQRRATDIVDLLFPFTARFEGRVDELEVLAGNEVDGVADPAALDFDAGGAVAEEGGAVGAVEVEHVGVAGDGGAEVGELEGWRGWVSMGKGGGGGSG